MTAPLVERLRSAAKSASDIARQMAEAKSLRQESNTEYRTDLYMWPTSEQTLEGQAADALALCEKAREEIAYHAEQLATYIAQPAISEKNLASARYHNDKIRTALATLREGEQS